MTAPPPTHATPPAASIDCETAVRRLWDYLDARFPAPAHEEVEAHLATCTRCPPHFAFARTLQQSLARSAPDASGDEARLRQRVRDALRRHVTSP